MAFVTVGAVDTGGLRGLRSCQIVAPQQPSLDGYCVEKGSIRQLVAMPLGEGYSAEEQLTGQAEFGGLQLEVFPMRGEVYERRFPVVRRKAYPRHASEAVEACASAMGMAPGGRMRQEIYRDPFLLQDWDTAHGSRCFVHLLNSVTWRKITGQPVPSKPVTARDYTLAGLPWFYYCDSDAQALQGSKVLDQMLSVKATGKEKGEHPLPENEPVLTSNIEHLRPGLKPHQVREANFD